MASSPQIMELETEQKPQIDVEFKVDKEIKSSLENSAAKDCEDNVDDGNKSPNEVDVDVTECGNSSSDIKFDETEDPNATEYSSSFNNTDDDDDDAENFTGISEGEVESQYLGDSGFDDFDRIFPSKKRKLTNHWKNYIRPVMWRCKWMELRMKELDMQVLKYSKELEAYDQGKPLELEQIASEGFCSKSYPFSSRYKRRKAMKRVKRKRVEDTTDIASYMSQHNFFSYLENKRSELDNASCADDFSNACKILTSEPNSDSNEKLGADDWMSFEYKIGDVSMEHVLSKIEALYSRVKNLRGQIDLVMSKNPAKFSSSENLSLLCPLDVQTSSAQSPAFSTGNIDEISPGAIYGTAQQLTDYDIGDLVLPGSVVSSFGEALVPDIIESTVGLLSAADVTLHQPQFVDSSEDIVENVLMHEDVGEGERHSFQRISDQQLLPKQEPDLWGLEDIKPCLVPSSSEQLDPMPANNSVALASCLASDVNFPRNKRKRGERKAGQVVWNKACSGDTDNQ